MTGTSAAPPDTRAIAEASRHGVDLTLQRARQITSADFDQFDLILAMDRNNLRKIEALRPAGNETTVRMFLDYAGPGHPEDVPDPWYEGNFDTVFTMIEDTAQRLLASL